MSKVIRSARDAYDYVSTFGLQEDRKCRLIVLYLALDGAVLDWNERGEDAGMIKLKDVEGAVYAIIVTSHPRGSSLPDKYDIQETMRMKELLGAKGLGLLDQLIVGSKEFYSYAEEKVTIVK